MRISDWSSDVCSSDLNFQPMSYSPRTGLVYIPYQQLGSRYVKGGTPEPGAFSFNGLTLYHVREEPDDNTGALLAWDPVAQKPRWKVHHDFLWNGGVLSTAGNLVFQGTADGYFTAYDAESGKQLWQFNAGQIGRASCRERVCQYV